MSTHGPEHTRILRVVPDSTTCVCIQLLSYSYLCVLYHIVRCACHKVEWRHDNRDQSLHPAWISTFVAVAHSQPLLICYLVKIAVADPLQNWTDQDLIRLISNRDS